MNSDLKVAEAALQKAGLTYAVEQEHPLAGWAEFDVGKIYFRFGDADRVITEEEFIAKLQKARDDIYNSEK